MRRPARGGVYPRGQQAGEVYVTPALTYVLATPYHDLLWRKSGYSFTISHTTELVYKSHFELCTKMVINGRWPCN